MDATRLSPARRFVAITAVVAATAVALACGSSTRTSTSPSTISRCDVSLRASAATMPSIGGTGRVLVTTERECAWSAASEASWLTINGLSSGQGDGSVEYRAAANNDPVSRRAAIVLNNQRADITQAAAVCVIRLRDSSAEFPQAGGSGSVQVEASSQMCTWTVSTDASWIALASATAGKGSAQIGFTVAPTTGPPRNGTIRVADQQFSVTQSEGCTYSIAPSGESVPASGGDRTIAVSTASGCPWSGLSNVRWIAVTQGATGTGPGTVRFTVAATEGPARTGTLVVAGRAITITQSAGCSYVVEPLAQAFGAAGGPAAVSVDSAPGCVWTASSQAPWITIAGASSGSGTGTLAFLVAASTGSARSGTLTVAGHTVTVSQAQGCSFAIAPEAQTVPPSGGAGTVAITSGPGCAWTARSNVEWLAITQGESGTGNGAVQFSAAATAGPARSGTLTIAGRTFTVNQGQACAATLAPEGATIAAAGGVAEYDVRTPEGCSWTATEDVPWIRIAAGASGSGNGRVRIETTANSGARRTGAVTAAGRTFTVQQESGCSVELSASGASVPSNGGTGTVNVRAAAGCTWTAAPDQPWITIRSGAAGAGNGTVAFSVAVNPGPPRSGAIVIGGQSFTITQGDACSYIIAPTEEDVPAAGANVTVSVTAAAGCTWTTSSQAPWIQVTAGASGSGNGTVRLAVEASTAAARVGTVTIAGQAFTVRQVSGCTFNLAPGSRSTGPAGGPGMFNVSTSSGNCSWTAVSSVPWISIVGDASGTGTDSVNYLVQPNPGPPRVGTISVEGRVFTLNQSGS